MSKQIQRALGWAALATILFAGWQFATVERNYQGNWTALYCTGDRKAIPPSLAPGTWIFHNSTGYDGTMYRYVAHDPFLSGEPHLFLDDPLLRSRRILVPGMAWLLALGNVRIIDGTYIVVVWIFVFAGSYWTCRWVQSAGASPAWALAFLLLPATLVSMDRLTIDVATAALTAGFVWYWHAGGDWKLYCAVMVASLSRETGVFLLVALLLSYVTRRQWKRAVFYATAVAPAFCWYVFVFSRIRAKASGSAAVMPKWLWSRHWPGPFYLLWHPVAYPFAPPWNYTPQVLDALALIGILAALVLGFVYWWRSRISAPHLAALLFALSVAAVLSPGFWVTVYGYARPFSPLFLILGGEAASEGSCGWLWLLPSIMIAPRILLQLGPQMLGILGLQVDITQVTP